MLKTLVITMLIAIWMSKFIRVAEFGKGISQISDWIHYQIAQSISESLFKSKQTSTIFHLNGGSNLESQLNRRSKLTRCIITRAP